MSNIPTPSIFKVGDPPPSGYVDWHEWASVQHRGGLRQRQCRNCGLWKFPQDSCRCAKASTGADMGGDRSEGVES